MIVAVHANKVLSAETGLVQGSTCQPVRTLIASHLASRGCKIDVSSACRTNHQTSLPDWDDLCLRFTLTWLTFFTGESLAIVFFTVECVADLWNK